MEFIDVLKSRRATRSLDKINISDEMIRQLAEAASLAPSCFNKQPWRFVFVREEKRLQKLFEVLPRGNKWAHKASMIVAVFSKKEDDCMLGDRDYYLFDTGFATNHMMLRATDLGLIAHPIAGYDKEKAMELLNIPPDYVLITLLIMGKKALEFNENLSDQQIEFETSRPDRKTFGEFAYLENFPESL
ncbi:MAG: nitroreductase family protein [Candidatus Marinimicrobia bacterium]|nr:nitroreductase family protein [Candidatus Neomarinimicrobiota bacterium]